MISEEEEAPKKVKKPIKIDKNERLPGELSDDDAYVQKLPKTEREWRKEKLAQ